MGKAKRKTIVRRCKKQVGIPNKTQTQRSRAKGSDEGSGTLKWSDRYGNVKNYKKQCAIAHKSTQGLCCVCLTRKSNHLHHAKYGRDRIGQTVFPVCKTCHSKVCHTAKNWHKDKDDPVWKNCNTPEFIKRLKLGYKLLYMGID